MSSNLPKATHALSVRAGVTTTQVSASDPLFLFWALILGILSLFRHFRGQMMLAPTPWPLSGVFYLYILFRPGTEAMQRILAEQTAMQASTVGSFLMLRRQTCPT